MIAGPPAGVVSRCCASRQRSARTPGWRLRVAEGEGFEPPVPFSTVVFKTTAFNRSATPPTRSV